jgi:hypothetical protein
MRLLLLLIRWKLRPRLLHLLHLLYLLYLLYLLHLLQSWLTYRALYPCLRPL